MIMPVPERTNRAATVREQTGQTNHQSTVRLLTRAALNACRDRFSEPETCGQGTLPGVWTLMQDSKISFIAALNARTGDTTTPGPAKSILGARETFGLLPAGPRISAGRYGSK